MKEFMNENGGLIFTIVLVLLTSIWIQMIIAYYMIKLVKESQTLEEGNSKWIKKWTEEYLKNEREITNIPVFVEKQIENFQINKFTLTHLKHISGQLLLLSIFFSGMGVCKEIIKGKTLGEILPFYIICLVGLYFHFLMSGVIDMEEKKKRIQRNVIDFLENKKDYLYKRNSVKVDEIEEIKDFYGEKEDRELKEILRQILCTDN